MRAYATMRSHEAESEAENGRRLENVHAEI